MEGEVFVALVRNEAMKLIDHIRKTVPNTQIAVASTVVAGVTLGIAAGITREAIIALTDEAIKHLKDIRNESC